MQAELKEVNGRITSTFLGIEDHGIPTCIITIEGGSWGQGFGNYDLRFYGINMLLRIIEVVEARSWEDLKGKHCRIRREHSKIHAIGHIIKDKWYSPETETNDAKKEKK